MEKRLLFQANRNLLVLAIVLCIGMFFTSRLVSAGQGPLDGKTYVVETGEKGKSGGDKDALIFKDGTFRSTGCDRYGFGDGAYTATVNGDSIRFEAVTTSPTKGKMNWNGVVTGNKIEVSYIWVDASHWYKPNPKPLEKWAKGELKK